MRPHLDYGDKTYDQSNNQSFTQKIEIIQYNATLAITGTIKGTSQNKLWSELGFESLKTSRWFLNLCTFLRIKETGIYQNTYYIPEYLFDIISQTIHLYSTCLKEDVTTFCSRTDIFKYSFFPSTIISCLQKIDSTHWIQIISKKISKIIAIILECMWKCSQYKSKLYLTTAL